ncbi:NAD(P)-dependent oxidoreductase [Pseudoalteromonas sp. S16_S37]|uniref:NAD(P)-dependent oxidoreductase n=1 Tax=Pseudoalteromonas sp. S16_S37 TaxID=2720228 RepID=UPI00168095F1|nr:NAD(P)-binding oxidoreductase [Pseudoalteromonas sp. S16_S37]MBD1584233.1 SDR family oxidoreductase [Pseudoalteromonas sp. S16_S37]
MAKHTLVLGGSGATGKLVISQLLERDVKVTAIVRASSSLQAIYGQNECYTEVTANIEELDVSELASLIKQCDSVICCLGHNLSFAGIYGAPRKLVVNALKKVTNAIDILNKDYKTKLILMSSTGVCNRDINEESPLSQRVIISVLRMLLPPQIDNELAVDHLRVNIAKDHPLIEWVCVRPDSLIDEQQTSSYALLVSPTRNVIFDAAKTSRINVAHFMTGLTSNTELWAQWKGRMPVIYNH